MVEIDAKKKKKRIVIVLLLSLHPVFRETASIIIISFSSEHLDYYFIHRSRFQCKMAQTLEEAKGEARIRI